MKFTERIISNFRRRIVTGILFILPITITYLVLRFLFITIDGILQPGFQAIFGKKIPGLGLVAMLVFVYFIGLLGSNILGRWLARIVHNIFAKIPIVNIIYTSAKQLIDSFSTERTTGFKRVVMVEYPKDDIWTLGFLTQIVKDENNKPMAIVYMPTAPTPQSGWMAVFDLEKVYDVDMTVQDAMRLVVSGGIVAPKQIRKVGSVKDSEHLT